jgi:DNA gyrase/topoisomerase IV subunit A
MAISPKLNQWINEIEQRPASAPFIVRRLSERLQELDRENEALRAENLSLRSGQKIQEFERKISELEYQIELLKRGVPDGNFPIQTSAHLLVYNTKGAVLSIELLPTDVQASNPILRLNSLPEQAAEDIQLLVVEPQDELLFLFDSGRALTMPAYDLPTFHQVATHWEQAYSLEMRSGEQLVCMLPITNAPLKAMAIQISRRGFARSFSREYFQSFLSNHNFGRGVKTQSDQVFNMSLCEPQDICLLVSRQGYLSALLASSLSVTLEENIKLGIKDYLVSSFVIPAEQAGEGFMVVVTSEGRIYSQKTSWLSSDSADGTKRRLILSKEKAGTLQVVAAAPAQQGDWGLLLDANGEIYAVQITANLKGETVKATPHPSQSPLTKPLAFTTTSLLQHLEE